MKQLPAILKNLLEKNVHWKIDLLEQWPKIVGGIADNTRVEKIADNTITIGVYDSCWLHELHMLSPKILKTIQTHLGNKNIQYIRLKQVPRHKKQTSTHLNDNYSQSYQEKPILNRREESALTTIHDQDLAEVLKKLKTRCVRMRTSETKKLTV